MWSPAMGRVASAVSASPSTLVLYHAARFLGIGYINQRFLGLGDGKLASKWSTYSLSS